MNNLREMSNVKGFFFWGGGGGLFLFCFVFVCLFVLLLFLFCCCFFILFIYLFIYFFFLAIRQKHDWLHRSIFYTFRRFLLPLSFCFTGSITSIFLNPLKPVPLIIRSRNVSISRVAKRSYTEQREKKAKQNKIKQK